MWVNGMAVATIIVGLVAVGGVIYTATYQYKAMAMKSFLDARLKAFLDYESAFAALSASKNRADTTLLHQAENLVAMLSSDQTIASVSKVQKIVQDWESGSDGLDVEALGYAHLEVIFDMHHDLLTFTQPRIVRPKKWQKSSR